MLSKLYTASLVGLDCRIIEVEVDYRRATNYFSIVGMADKSIQEAKDRIPSAIRNSGYEYVPMSIVMNLAPAELRKSGPSYDLPLAIGYLLASDQLDFDTSKKLFIGELALNGDLRSVSGILPIVDAIKRLGFEEIYLPLDNMNEAMLIEGVKVYGFSTLKKLGDFLSGFTKETDLEKPILSEPKIQTSRLFDFSEVKGQEQAKRALEIAAAGGHNILMSGVPGSGKTMLSRCFAGILPTMDINESLEVTRIYSVAGLTSKELHLIKDRPFRTPHHTSSQVALVGGGGFIKPGEISLAHRGVLFLDEFPEFSSLALEALRQPMEDKIVTISRASGTITFPANFILVAAMNPCRCGFKGDPVKQCVCTPLEATKYIKRISGPILDRIDLLVNIQKVENEKFFQKDKSESSQSISIRVQNARNFAKARYKDLNILCNADLSQKAISEFISLDLESELILKKAVNAMNLSARSYYRVLKVARTIADISNDIQVNKNHILEALSYRVEIGN